MAGLTFYPAEEFRRQAESIVATVAESIAQLVGRGEIEHIGATAIPGALTKGDVDVLVRVARDDFPAAVDALKRRFAIHQPENWNADFASFRDEITFSLPLGIQLVVKGADSDFFLYLRDRLRADARLLAEYNQLKTRHGGGKPENYWRAKNRFFERMLAERPPNSA
ncbi:MAG: GrpB family protein [Opitutaceae bacterium]|jgi:uncharacterized protein